MNAASILNVLKLILTLEPAAFALVESLVQGVSGKSDAEILSADASTWSSIISGAQPPASK